MLPFMAPLPLPPQFFILPVLKEVQPGKFPLDVTSQPIYPRICPAFGPWRLICVYIEPMLFPPCASVAVAVIVYWVKPFVVIGLGFIETFVTFGLLVIGGDVGVGVG